MTYDYWKAQLNNSKTTRRVRFSDSGWEALKTFKGQMEQRLRREISESVALDILLTRDDSPYRERPRFNKGDR